ncbi:MAG: FAD-dependent oxidoreductase [Maricaulaceae bacterium]
MVKPPHILIIGAGLIGLATARACVNKGAKITLVERQSHTGHGAGFANSGMIHRSQAWPWVTGDLRASDQRQAAQNVAALATTSVESLKHRMAQLDLSDVMRATGCFKFFETDALRDHAKSQYLDIAVQTRDTEIFGRPALSFPNDFSGNAYEWSQAETRALINDGVTVKTNVQIILHEENGHVSATSNGRKVKADHIILCAGYNTNTLLAPLGLSLPIKPERGFALDFDITDIDLSSLPQAPIMDAASNSALTFFDQTLRLSGTLGQQTARPLWQRWCDLAPQIMSRLGDPNRVWSGFRPVSELGRPIISPSPLKGLWVNSGHGHMGWTLSLVSGALMRDLVLDDYQDTRFGWPQD